MGLKETEHDRERNREIREGFEAVSKSIIKGAEIVARAIHSAASEPPEEKREDQ